MYGWECEVFEDGCKEELFVVVCVPFLELLFERFGIVDEGVGPAVAEVGVPIFDVW